MTARTMLAEGHDPKTIIEMWRPGATPMAKNSTQQRDMASDITGAIREGTKKWTRTRMAEERSPASRSFRMSRLTRERGVSFKEAAAEIMEKAYMQASGDRALPANARQIMYAARPHIQETTGKQLNDNYFTQTLLPDYIEENDIDDWDVVYDARGHFTEPHDGESIGVGTLEVRQYLADFQEPSLIEAGISNAKVETAGPDGNFWCGPVHRKRGLRPDPQDRTDR
jgi:hypothetical protein